MDSRTEAAVCVRRWVLATIADELVIRVCPIVGLGRDGASLDLPEKSVDGDDNECNERRNKGEAGEEDRRMQDV